MMVPFFVKLVVYFGVGMITAIAGGYHQWDMRKKFIVATVGGAAWAGLFAIIEGKI